MKKLATLLGMTLLAISAIGFTGSASAAGATECTHILAPGTYQRVVVPEGAVCFSRGGVHILSGLWIRPGATFVLGTEESGWTTGTIGGGRPPRGSAPHPIHLAAHQGGGRTPPGPTPA